MFTRISQLLTWEYGRWDVLSAAAPADRIGTGDLSCAEANLSTLSTEPRFRSAIDSCIAALHRLADYELEAPLASRLQSLAERKELLSADEYQELMALVAFSQQRSIDKLQAQVALRRIEEVLPDLVGSP